MTAWYPETLSDFRSLMEYSMDLVSVLDESGMILYQSPSAEHILGEDPDARVGTNAFDYVHPDDRGHIMERFAEMVQSPGTVSERVEYRFKHGDGSWIWIESVASNQTDTAIDGYVINSRKITERKQNEKRLEQQNKQLEEFASVISHDIRNPLTVAEGRLELVQKECDSEHIDPIDRALTRINAIIDDLLMLAREGNQVSETDPVNIGDLSAECWRTVETSDATIHTMINRTIHADRTRLAQLLENLFRNGIEHGGGDVSITVGELDDGFYVEDDGPGIPKAERTDVFDAGYSSSEDGIGIGLSIVRQVAEAHGWDISVLNGSAGGARFEVTGVNFAE